MSDRYLTLHSRPTNLGAVSACGSGRPVKITFEGRELLDVKAWSLPLEVPLLGADVRDIPLLLECGYLPLDVWVP